MAHLNYHKSLAHGDRFFRCSFPGCRQLSCGLAKAMRHRTAILPHAHTSDPLPHIPERPADWERVMTASPGPIFQDHQGEEPDRTRRGSLSHSPPTEPEDQPAPKSRRAIRESPGCLPSCPSPRFEAETTSSVPRSSSLAAGSPEWSSPDVMVEPVDEDDERRVSSASSPEPSSTSAPTCHPQLLRAGDLVTVAARYQEEEFEGVIRRVYEEYVVPNGSTLPAGAGKLLERPLRRPALSMALLKPGVRK